MGSFVSKGQESSFRGVTRELLFEDIKASLEARLGKIPVHSRYHQEPRTLDVDYDIRSDILGSGANGDVRLGTSKRNSRLKVAVKSFALEVMSASERSFLTAELETYLTMDHPHIARLLDVYESQDHLHLVMECMEGGDLFDRIDRKKKFSEEEASKALRQMLLALNYMHSHGYVHRDVKLENFVYDAEGSDWLKLIDFGFSTRWDPNANEKMHACLGTTTYCAPEVLQGSYTSQCDLWSLGVVAYIILCGKMPFRGTDRQQMKSISAGAYPMDPKDWGGMSAECKDFVRSLLQTDPTRRLSAPAALEHPWIVKHHTASQDVAPILKCLREYSRTSAFQRCCSEVLAWSASNDDQAKVRDSFLALDVSQQGSLTFEELRDAMLKEFPTLEEEHVLSICDALDHSHDKRIHYSDFLSGMMGSQISFTHDMMVDAFRRLDVDNSGRISADNLLHCAGILFHEIFESVTQEVVKSSEGICFEPFLSYFEGSGPPHLGRGGTQKWTNYSIFRTMWKITSLCA